MTKSVLKAVSRRTILRGAGGLAVLGASLSMPFVKARAAEPVKVGLMLPYSGTYAALGENITFAIEMHLAEMGGSYGGRAIEFVKLDDESDPAKATENVNRLISRDEVDCIIGTVHSGVLMAMVQVVKESGTLLICPNAGAGAATGKLCTPNFFRTSFSNWQPAYGSGKAMGAAGVKKAVFVTWDYAAGKEASEGFKAGLEEGGGTLVQTLTVPFPETNWQPLLAQIPGLGVEAVGAFFAGGGAVQFVKDYAAAGLKDQIPLGGSGFLTEGTLGGQGEAANGIKTALHYGDGIDTPRNNAFREAFKAKAGREADVYAVQGYDAAQLLSIGLTKTQGDIANQDAVIAEMAVATIDSPRGAFTLSKAHNPVQDFYLREVKDGKNLVVGMAAEKLADPASGCELG
jgi:branched-chain amino acid transport system substrate-binding protein